MSKLGEDGKRLIASLPQHVASYIGKRAVWRIATKTEYEQIAQDIQQINFTHGFVSSPLWSVEWMRAHYCQTGEVKHPFLRLFIHDEWLTEVPEGFEQAIDEILLQEMERPIPILPLDPSWNMGTHLAIGTEGKRGQSWGEMG